MCYMLPVCVVYVLSRVYTYCQCELVCDVSMTLLLFQHSHVVAVTGPDQLVSCASPCPSLLLLLQNHQTFAHNSDMKG